LPHIRLTHNAVLAFHRAVCPEDSLSGAYRRLGRALETARVSESPPAWVRDRGTRNDGYLILASEDVALPVRRGRAVSCMVDREAFAEPKDRG
jgi:hypothetical protein